MPLSSELVSQFAKLASNKPKEEKESTVYGTTVIQNGNKYVKLDGSELLTPASFTTNIADGERVTVLIKNHMAVVTGNITSPAARTSEVEEVGNEVEEVGNEVKALNAAKANIEDLEATNASIANLDATKANVTDLTAVNASIENLNATKANVTDLTTVNASIANLDATKANIEDLKTTYANIDFANVGVADIKKFYAKAGVIQDIDIQNQKITGRLVGVRITGDLIEGETVKANNLIILGDDGLYYKLNVNALGEAEASKDDKYKYGLDGSVIVAESITADKVSVSDLVAFGATIGGFHITSESLYSGTKESVDNTTAGIFMDKTGQMAVGDSTNFIKFYKDTDGSYKLAISADSLTFSTGQTIKDGIDGKNGVSVMSIVRYYMMKTSSQETPPDKPTTNPPSDSWSNIEPGYNPDGYLYFVDLTTFSDGSFSYSDVSLSSTYSAVKDAEKKADEAKAKADDAQDSLDDTNQKLKTYFDFGDDLTIRKDNSPFKISISNEEIQIKQDTELIQKFDKDGNGIIPKLKVTSLLNLMGYQLEKDSAGNLNCVYVGG